MAAALSGLRAWLGQREDDAGLVIFRVLFGLLAAGAALRFVAKGWVEALLAAPPVHLPWVRGLETPPNTMLYLLFAAQVIGGLLVAQGRATRAGLGLWLAAFIYVELLDKTLYLNHYVFLTLVGATLWALPWGPGGRMAGGAPRWARALLRLEVGLVWLWAGLAKLNADWLLRGWPLGRRGWQQLRCMALPATWGSRAGQRAAGQRAARRRSRATLAGRCMGGARKAPAARTEAPRDHGQTGALTAHSGGVHATGRRTL